MPDDISAEEQRQIDAAIALSMGQEPPQEAKSTTMNEPIYIDDEDDEYDDYQENTSKTGFASLSKEAVKHLNSTSTSSINASRKHVHDDDDCASVDSEATELSIDDMKDSRPDERKKGKRQMSEETSEVTRKKARNETSEADSEQKSLSVYA
jgi:hypothetical protein